MAIDQGAQVWSLNSRPLSASSLISSGSSPMSPSANLSASVLYVNNDAAAAAAAAAAATAAATAAAAAAAATAGASAPLNDGISLSFPLPLGTSKPEVGSFTR